MSDAWTSFFEREAQGWSFRRALEALLLELDDAEAELLQLELREGRGAWLALLAAPGGRALYAGSACSGTIAALALQGFQVDVLDPNAERRRFCSFRARVEPVEQPRGPYRLIVLEDGLPRFDSLLEPDGELVLVADNRLGYKRSLGRKGAFRINGPFEFMRHPSRRTLGGWRKLLSGAGRTVESYALYPHRLDFSHIVALERPYPALSIGPMERKNWFKLAAKALGLFPVLTPSFAFIARRSTGPRRIERVLGILAERLGVRTPEVEAVVATRGNNAIVHTRGSASWTLHIPLAPKNVPQTERHFRTLGEVRARFPDLPMPEPLFCGTLDGLTLSCERSLPGLTASQAPRGKPRLARMLEKVAELLQRLVVRAPRPFDHADFEALVAAPPAPLNLDAMFSEARAKLVGKSMPLVFQHADLRAKHIKVDPDGNVLGIIDWSTAVPEGLPYFDLLHLVVHEVRQEHDLTTGAAWRRVLARDLRAYERECLERYCAAIGLAPEVARAIEEVYPLLLAAVAEKHWDYSRPRWVQRQFALA